MSADRKNFIESLDITTRRSFLRLAAMAGVSSSMLIAGSGITLASAGDKGKDLSILNTALGLEHQAIAAYQAGAESKLLSDPYLKVAVKFQDQHKQHRDTLASTIKKLGGKPVEAQAKYDVGAIAKSVNVNLAGEKDVLTLAMRLEEAATKAYLGAIPALENKDLVKAAASIMADEAQHTAILRSALGEDPVPQAFVG